MVAGGRAVRLALFGLVSTGRFARARGSDSGATSSLELCSLGRCRGPGLAKELAAGDDFEHLSLLQTRGPAAVTPRATDRDVEQVAAGDSPLCDPVGSSAHSRMALVLSAGGGDVEPLSLLQTRGPSAVPPRAAAGEALVQASALGDEPFWLSAAREADGEELARNISQAIDLVLRFANGSDGVQMPRLPEPTAAEDLAPAGRVAPGRGQSSSVVPLLEAEGARHLRSRRNASLQSLEAFEREEQQQRREDDTIPWAELARAFAAMAAESTASVEEGMRTLPSSLGRRQGRSMNLDFDINGGVEAGVPHLVTRSPGGGNVSFVDVNGTELAQDPSDVTDAILTPAALGAAVGVVVGAAVGLN